MRVLVTGANGFIGARVVTALREAGYEVVAAMRYAAAPGTIACDFSSGIDVEMWKPRLAGVDAVVNCAGILRETHNDTFARVHVDAPLALFRACAATGVRRVIQLSALGEPADGEFIASKHRCDQALAELDIDWLVLRPGLVYSAHGAYGGTILLRAFAALPGAIVVPGDGTQQMRPLALEDLVAAIAAALARPQYCRQIIELVGPDVLSLRDYLVAWRLWFGLSAPRAIATPRWLANTAVAIGEASGRGPLCRVIANLLERGRIGGADALARTQALLGRAPATLAQALAHRPSDARDLLQARWYLARPLLLGTLALTWIASGIVGLSISTSTAAAALPAWSRAFVNTTTWGCSAVDIALGIALLIGRRLRVVLGLMLAMVAVYTLGLGLLAPAHWLDPFGGLLKNFMIAAALVALLMLDTPRR
jgi:uncharacterized protein YbjT (DUF2867 family)